MSASSRAKKKNKKKTNNSDAGSPAPGSRSSGAAATPAAATQEQQDASEPAVAAPGAGGAQRSIADKADSKSGVDNVLSAVQKMMAAREKAMVAHFEHLLERAHSKPERSSRNRVMTGKGALWAAMEAAEAEAKKELTEQRKELEAALQDGGEVKQGTEDAADSDYEETPNMPKLPKHLRVGESDDEESESDDEASVADGPADQKSEAKGADAAAGAALDLGDYRRHLAAIAHGGQKATIWVHRMVPSSAKGGHLHERAMLLAQVFDVLHQPGAGAAAVDEAKRLLVQGLVALWLAYEDDAWSALDALTVNPLVPLDRDTRLRIARQEHLIAKYKKKKTAGGNRRGGGAHPPSQLQPRAASATASASANKGKGSRTGPKGAGGH